MAEYLLVESQGSYAGPGAEAFLGDAVRLARAGHGVAVLLIENGVTEGLTAAGPAVGRVLAAGGEVWADAFSLDQRALSAQRLAPGVRAVEMDEVAERLLRPGVRGVWH
ncbi:hypothetical protein ACFWJT_08305 [Streptomyces sp. NPDC127069]|uniref:hypothetical protein n=1 Tax=Streptomyces sp. NPDC127069 TaxID=3347128 RepID=UPI003653D8F4